MSTPSSDTVPANFALGTNSCMRFKMRRNVDFPQPEGPISAVTSFGRIASETRSKTLRDPNQALIESATSAEPRRALKPLEAKALDSLDLTGTATKAEIKSRFKELVKRHHPDANGGDTRSEDKLREVIQAYNYLRQAGLA